MSVPPSFCRSAFISMVVLGSLLSTAHAQSLTLGNSDFSSPELSTYGSAVVSQSGTSASGVYVYGDGASAATSDYDTVDVTGDLTLRSGASINDLTVEYVNGVGNIEGGYIDRLDAADGDYIGSGGTINISGGIVNEISAVTNVSLYDINISGGTVPLLTTGGDLNVSGGSIGSLDLRLDYLGDGEYIGGVSDITSGTVGVVHATGAYSFDAGTPTSVNTTCNIGGGAVNSLIATDYGGFDITGTDLSLTSDGYVTGVLSDGSTIHASFTNTDGLGFLKFNGVAAVPEASSLFSFGLLLALGLGGWAITKKRSPLKIVVRGS